MYYVHTKELIVDDPYPMYENQSELIEADGEAEEAWMQVVVDDQYPTRNFSVIDWKSDEQIDLDIADYLGEKTYNLFEQCIFNLGEEDFSEVKANSFLQACIMHSRKQNRRNRGQR